MLLEGRQFLGRHFGGEQLHLGRRDVGVNALHEKINGKSVQSRQLFFIGPGWRPRGEENLHPAFVFQGAQNLQPVVLMGDLFQFPAALMGGKGLDDSLTLGVFIAHLGFGVEFPTEARLVSGGADHQGGFFEEPIV